MNMAYCELATGPRAGAWAKVLLPFLAIVGVLFGIQPVAASVSDADIESQSVRLQNAEALLVHARGAGASLVQLLVAPDRDTRVVLYKQIDAANVAADETLATLIRQARSPEEKSRDAELQAQRARYDELYTSAVEEIELNGAQGALAQFWAGTRDAHVQLETKVAEMVKYERMRLDELRAARAAAANESRTMIMIGAAVGVVAVIGILAARTLRRRHPA